MERNVVWELSNKLWRRKYDSDMPKSEGAILGGGLAGSYPEGSDTKPGVGRMKGQRSGYFGKAKSTEYSIGRLSFI